MKQIFETEILTNFEVAEKIFRLEVDLPELAVLAKPGQFVEIKLSNEFTLRRPFGVASTKDGIIKMFYRVVGKGTKFLSEKKVGDRLNILGTLGNGFNTEIEGKVLLVGGGMGLAPLLSAAEKIDDVEVLIGGKNRAEAVFWYREFRPLVKNFYVTTDDGSLGRKGFVTDLLSSVLQTEEYSAVYTCGPEIMMRGVAFEAMARDLICEVSFERRMACGLGACLSCSIDTANGRKKVCKDGPVFDAKEIFF